MKISVHQVAVQRKKLKMLDKIWILGKGGNSYAVYKDHSIGWYRSS